MREDLRHIAYGTPILRWIQDRAGSARHEFETFSAIVSAGRHGYKLEGDELVEFARRCLYAMLEAGAKPVVFTTGDGPQFRLTDVYGTANDEIVEMIIAEWLADGGGDLPWGVYPFTFPENI